MTNQRTLNLALVLLASAIVMLSLCAKPAEAQDYDGDGQVAFVDFLIFAQAYNSVNATIDLSGDGFVGFLDLYFFIQNFGNSAPFTLVPPTTGPNASAVPALDLDSSGNDTDDGNQTGTVAGSGTTFTVQVFAKSLSTSLNGLEIVFDIDLSKVKVTGATSPNSSGFNGPFSPSDNRVTISAFSATPPGDGLLGTVTFTTQSDVTGVPFTIGLTKLSVMTGSTIDDLDVSGVEIAINAGPPPGETPVGTDVPVQPVDPTTGTSPAVMTFSNVVTPGETSLESSTSGPPPPSGFQLGDPPTYYDISTTAVFSGPVEVCIDYSGVIVPDENNLKLLHFEGGSWVDVTTSLDTVGDIICGNVTSFSFFAVFVQSDATPPDITAAFEPAGEVEEDEGTFRLQFSAVDNVDPNPTVTAVLQIPGREIVVTDGQIVEIEIDDDDVEVESEDGILEIEAPQVVLLVTATDESGNTATNQVLPPFDEGDDDDEDGDDDDGDDDDGDDDDGDDDDGDDDDGASKPVVGLPLPSGMGANGYAPDSHFYSLGVPKSFSLSQNAPNPFNPSTTIRYTLEEAADVRLAIYNILGQRVRVLLNASQTPGVHSVQWDGRDVLGRIVSSGLYLYRLEAGENVAVRKMVFSK